MLCNQNVSFSEVRESGHRPEVKETATPARVKKTFRGGRFENEPLGHTCESRPHRYPRTHPSVLPAPRREPSRLPGNRHNCDRQRREKFAERHKKDAFAPPFPESFSLRKSVLRYANCFRAVNKGVAEDFREAGPLRVCARSHNGQWPGPLSRGNPGRNPVQTEPSHSRDTLLRPAKSRSQNCTCRLGGPECRGGHGCPGATEAGFGTDSKKREECKVAFSERSGSASSGREKQKTFQKYVS